MGWVITATVGTGLLGAFNQRENALQQEKNQKQQMLAQAAQDQYSPWTHAAVSPGQGVSAPSATGATLGGALQGGVTGGLVGSQIKKMQAAPPPNAPQAPPAPQATVGGAADNSAGFGDVWSQMSMKPNLYNPMA